MQQTCESEAYLPDEDLIFEVVSKAEVTVFSTRRLTKMLLSSLEEERYEKW